MIADQEAARQDPQAWIEKHLWLRTKARELVWFVLNDVQRDYYEHRTRRDIILKPRQQGFTTIIAGLFFADCLLLPNTTSVIVAHDNESSEKIFRIVQLFWEHLSAEERTWVGRPRFSNRREFLWPKLNSHFYVGTAGALAFGRGQTINNLHCSEFAFWPRPEEALVSLTQAVPADGRIVIESTANGVGNHFHALYRAADKGENRFKPHFYVWFEDPTYTLAVTSEEAAALRASLKPEERGLVERYRLTMGQIKWRREKHRELHDLFVQEYPENDLDCFLASVRGCFDREALHQAATRIAAAAAPQRMEVLGGGKGDVPMAPGQLLVWQPPVKGRGYVIGADVGEGLAKGDASAACVLDRETGAQVAELHGRVPPERFAQQLDLLGRWYNRAMLAVERNNHGHSTLNTLRNVCLYPRLYYHVRYDHGRQAAPILGWPTDQATKPILVDDLAAAIAQGALMINSAGLVDECMTFISTDSGSQEAQEGSHDDRVIAAGIAWQARKRARPHPIAQRPEGW